MLSINAKVTKWFNVAAKASYNVFDYEGPTQQTGWYKPWSYAKPISGKLIYDLYRQDQTNFVPESPNRIP